MLLSWSILCIAMMICNQTTDVSDRVGPAAFGPETRRPLPRFASTKRKITNVRSGPGLDYPLKWTFVRQRLPLEIVAEFGNWRKIRDWSGTEGWIFSGLLSGQRAALVRPWMKAKLEALRNAPQNDAPPIAMLEPKVLALLNYCDGQWCKATVRQHEGFLRQRAIWGAYPGEKF